MDSGKKAVIGGGVFARNQRGRSKCLQAPARDYGLIFDLALEASDIGNTSGTISSGLRLVSYYIYIRKKTIASITTLCRQSLGFICFSAECDLKQGAEIAGVILSDPEPVLSVRTK
jgi:hypothetical protein